MMMMIVKVNILRMSSALTISDSRTEHLVFLNQNMHNTANYVDALQVNKRSP